MSNTSKGPSVKEDLVSQIRQKAGESGKLTCAEARTMAEEHGIGYAELGKILDELKIKVSDCALGCL